MRIREKVTFFLPHKRILLFLSFSIYRNIFFTIFYDFWRLNSEFFRCVYLCSQFQGGLERDRKRRNGGKREDFVSEKRPLDSALTYLPRGILIYKRMYSVV